MPGLKDNVKYLNLIAKHEPKSNSSNWSCSDGGPSESTRISKASWVSITTKAADSRAGTTTFPSPSAATRSSLLNACGIFPPRPEGQKKPDRSPSRPERHFADCFITARLAIARVIASWLPRCPTCHRRNQNVRQQPLQI